MQSFADLWVDFLLKEGEERGRREAGHGSNLKEETSPNATAATNHSSRSNISVGHNTLQSHGNWRPYEPPDSEFATVPLTSPLPRSLPKY